MTGYRDAYASYLCATQGHQVIQNSAATAPQPFMGGTCLRCGQYIEPEKPARNHLTGSGEEEA